jgi:hypothetical protein
MVLARVDEIGIDDSGESDVLLTMANRHLLLAGNQQIAVGQHLDDRHRNGPGEHVVGGSVALATANGCCCLPSAR